ncbi:MAG: D-alanine--D-alanine ligase [Deltaproteobacteria bacterium]|jgi:D-alanine-D-alanine ligase|nr:D-alanine--D-alanine ligase [Deltaproteobacteria bacterium]MBW2537890.1 D-alanine--D-alanine ligase [Deltaproteobacteria bacterium]
MHEETVPPDTIDGFEYQEMLEWKGEYDVMATLEELGHDPLRVGLYDDLSVLRAAIRDHKPHIAFNLLEEFRGIGEFDQHVVSYLELLGLPYTGCNPRGLTISRDKALTKKILAYHRIRVPHFAVFERGRRVRRRKNLEFPLFVKSVSDDASIGIAKASIVRDDAQLAERVDFVHRNVGTDAIAEQYIEGRELYVGVLGNRRPIAFPPWELFFDNVPEGEPRIATRKVKWDAAYQEKAGIRSGHAADLSEDLELAIRKRAKRIYRLLGLSGYGRMDFRLAADGRLYLLEANANPYIAFGEDFAESAEADGIGYEELIQRILRLGLRYRREFVG